MFCAAGVRYWTDSEGSGLMLSHNYVKYICTQIQISYTPKLKSRNNGICIDLYGYVLICTDMY
jgi:hypothetical protein